MPDMQRRVVETLPGCGRVMARELLQHFGSVERLERNKPVIPTFRGRREDL